jgi:O-antigen biosynthesis protein
MSTVLFIGKVWPEPASSAAGTRLLQLIEFFTGQGYKVVFASAAVKNEHSQSCAAYGYEEVGLLLNDDSFDRFVHSLAPAFVVFDRFTTEEQFGWRVSENCPGAMKILDTEDLHFLRKARHKAVLTGKTIKEAHLETEDTARELASMYRCDLSLIISEAEMDLLTGYFRMDTALLHYLPFAFASDLKTTPGFEERSGFLFIGNFHHAPNRDAVLQLKEHIWPGIHKQLPHVQMNIFGAYLTPEIKKLNDTTNSFLVHGRAEQADEKFGRSRVLLAPLRFGAGLKGKLLHAMLHGIPSVTSSCGAEGIAGDHNWPGGVSDDPEVFIHHAVTLYTNREKWVAAQTAGSKIINERFERSFHFSALKQRLKKLAENIKEHRTANFIGFMLTREHLNAGRYMSKWIEAKNRIALK